MNIASFSCLTNTGRAVVRNDNEYTQAAKDEKSRKKCKQKEQAYSLQGIGENNSQHQCAKRHKQGQYYHPAQQDVQALPEREHLISIIGEE
jgi:hypothetical protein